MHVAHIVTAALGAVTIPIVSMKTRPVYGFRYMIDCSCHLLYYILYACQGHLLAAYPGSEYTGYLNGDGITDTIVMTMCLQATNIRSTDYLGFEGH